MFWQTGNDIGIIDFVFQLKLRIDFLFLQLYLFVYYVISNSFKIKCNDLSVCEIVGLSEVWIPRFFLCKCKTKFTKLKKMWLHQISLLWYWHFVVVLFTFVNFWCCIYFYVSIYIVYAYVKSEQNHNSSCVCHFLRSNSWRQIYVNLPNLRKCVVYCDIDILFLFCLFLWCFRIVPMYNVNAYVRTLKPVYKICQLKEPTNTGLCIIT